MCWYCQYELYPYLLTKGSEKVLKLKAKPFPVIELTGIRAGRPMVSVQYRKPRSLSYIGGEVKSNIERIPAPVGITVAWSNAYLY